MTGGTIRTGGELSSAVTTRNGGGVVDLDGVSIHTTGANSDGLWAQQGGTIKARNTTIVTESADTHGVWTMGGTVSLGNVQIDTIGTYGVGLFVSNNGAIDAREVTINTAVTEHMEPIWEPVP